MEGGVVRSRGWTGSNFVELEKKLAAQHWPVQVTLDRLLRSQRMYL
jgi:hypothetical protein